MLIETMFVPQIHWAMALHSRRPNNLEKKPDLEAQLHLIQYFGVFHDFGETGSGGLLTTKEALDRRTVTPSTHCLNSQLSLTSKT